MGIQMRLVRKLPAWVRLAPLDVMFSFMGLVSSITLLLGPARTGSINSILPRWGSLLWGVCLLVGCLAWLIGLTSIQDKGSAMVVSRMPYLIFGLYLVSMAASVYGLVVIMFAGWNGVVAGTSFMAVAGGTYLRRIGFADQLRGNQ